MDREREFNDLPLLARLACIFVLVLAITIVVVSGVAKAVASCDPRPVWVRGSSDPEAPPWER